MCKKILSIVIAVILFTFTAGIETFANDTKPVNTADKIDAYLNALQQNKNFHGSILVAKNEKVILSKGYGMANFEEKVKNTPKTRYAIGSVSKQFTAMAVMQLYEKGRLGLNDKLSMYFPDLLNGDKITIHNLLVHNSGLVNYTDLPELYLMKDSEINIDSLIGLFNKLPLKAKPGEKYEYCNSGYLLLSRIIEKVSGLSFEKYLKKNIFDPLDMKDTGLISPSGRELQKTVGYTGHLEVFPIKNDIIMKATYGAGSLYSTVEDMYKWDRALYTDKLLKSKNIKLMLKGYSNMGDGYSYGYGWALTSGKNGTEAVHGGQTLSYTSYIGRCIDKNFTVIILTNTAGYNVANLANILTDIYNGNTYALPKPVKTANIDKTIYKDYVGQYQFAGNTIIEITSDGSHLYAMVAGQDKFEIFPETSNKFYYKVEEAEISFQRDNNGKVSELTLYQNGAQSNAKKVGHVKPEKTAVEVEQKILDSYAGEYEVQSGVSVLITSAAGHLYAQVTGQDKFEIFAESDNTFFYRIVDTQIKFNKDSEGNIKELVIIQGGASTTCKKIK